MCCGVLGLGWVRILENRAVDLRGSGKAGKRGELRTRVCTVPTCGGERDVDLRVAGVERAVSGAVDAGMREEGFAGRFECPQLAQGGEGWWKRWGIPGSFRGLRGDFPRGLKPRWVGWFMYGLKPVPFIENFMSLKFCVWRAVIGKFSGERAGRRGLDDKCKKYSELDGTLAIAWNYWENA